MLHGNRLNNYSKLMFLGGNIQSHFDLFSFLSQASEFRYYCMLAIDKTLILNKSYICIFLAVRY